MISQFKKFKDIDTNGFVTETCYYSKIYEIKGKILSSNGLADAAAIAEVKNNIPNDSDLLKRQITMQK